MHNNDVARTMIKTNMCYPVYPKISAFSIKKRKECKDLNMGNAVSKLKIHCL
jgi:hypothetical protein